ncbi:MAG: DUF4132 domain-containing protein [Lachnospiraceae bacterium]|nr:DUF4132 domain-containing protein [Lachnospiraceae bacterium]
MASASEKKAKEEAKAAKLAAKLGITLEELADRNVPEVGFDQNGERRFDYGTRSFAVTLCAVAPGVKFGVFELKEQKTEKAGKKNRDAAAGRSGSGNKTAAADGSNLVYGKMTRSLPKPGKNDDPERAEAAQEEFKKMKKELNAVVKVQKKRLELALMTGRYWSTDAWMELFGKHPIMRCMAFALVWGIYESGQLVQTFCCREDGLFYNIEGKEFSLPEDVKIGLVYPLELSKEERKAWLEQIWEDNIKEPPIGQLDLKTYIVHKQEAKKKKLVRCKGKLFLDEVFGGKLEKFGWHRGRMDEEHDFYDIYYREDKDAGLSVELHTSGNTPWDNMEIELYGVRFFEAGTFDWETHIYDEKDEEKAITLQDVKDRYFSEVVRQIMEAGAESYLWDGSADID